MRGFKARNMRFCSVSELGLGEERLLWYFKLKHFAYLAIAAISFSIGMRSPIALIFSIAFSLLAIMAALYPKRAVSFEAQIIGFLNYVLTRRKRRALVDVKKAQSETTKNMEKQMRKWDTLTDHELLVEDNGVAGESVRSVVEMRKKKVKKV